MKISRKNPVEWNSIFQLNPLCRQILTSSVCALNATSLLSTSALGALFLTKHHTEFCSVVDILQFYWHHIPGNKGQGAPYLSWGGCHCPDIHWRSCWHPASARLFAGQAGPGGFSSRHPVFLNETDLQVKERRGKWRIIAVRISAATREFRPSVPDTFCTREMFCLARDCCKRISVMSLT